MSHRKSGAANLSKSPFFVLFHFFSFIGTESSWNRQNDSSPRGFHRRVTNSFKDEAERLILLFSGGSPEEGDSQLSWQRVAVLKVRG